jgi:hypothetical protein
MKRILAGTLSLSLAWFAGHATAEELNWRSVQVSPTATAAAPAPALGVSLGQPIPLMDSAPAPIVRAKAADNGVQQLPDTLFPTYSPGRSMGGLVRTSFAVESPEFINGGSPPVAGVPTAAVPGPVDPCAPCPPCPEGPCNPCPPCPEDPCCNALHCPPDPCCEPVNRFYVRGEYLFWGIHHMAVPPLVTAGTATGFGILSGQGTSLLFGGSGLDQEPRSGGRLTAGWWFDPCQTWGIEASGFILGEGSANFVAGPGAAGLPVLARPFFNLSTLTPSAEVASDLSRNLGSVRVDAPSHLWGAELDLRRNLCSGCCWRLDLLGGFRYVRLDEGLHITEHGMFTTAIPTTLPGLTLMPGDQFTVQDRFDTRNQFYGGQLGASAELHRGPWSLDLRAKVALGDMHQVLDVNGATIIQPLTSPPLTFPGGLLALGSIPGVGAGNIGHYSRDRFGVVPELGITVGYDLTCRLRIFAGYNVLYLSNVLRPGDQVDLALNPFLVPSFRLVPGSLLGAPVAGIHPAVPFRDTSFWAQGVTCGLEFRF